jgi:hypothetical protein
LQLGLVVKEQVVLGQMLVCYEFILTGESSALSSSVLVIGIPQLGSF